MTVFDVKADVFSDWVSQDVDSRGDTADCAGKSELAEKRGEMVEGHGVDLFADCEWESVRLLEWF